MITAIGLIIFPICLFYAGTPARLLALVFICSAFMAAAVVVIGGYGVSPGLLPTAMFVVFFSLNTIFGIRYPAERLVLRVLIPFILVVIWALIGSYLLPRFFETDILVWPQKATIIAISPLEPNAGNMTQDFYLVMAAALTISAACYLTKADLNLRRLFDAYLAAGCLVVAIAIWQLAGHVAGIWFPTEFFLSNPGWAQLSNETIGSFIRLTGPCSEPSELASYLCGTVGACGWIVLNGHKDLFPKLAFVAAFLVVLLSTSTTGYAALCGMALLAGIYAAFLGSAVLRKRVAFGFIGMAAVVGLSAVTVPMVSPGLADTATTIITSTLGKQHSASYAQRTSADQDSIRAMEQSYGLGVGWGSNRSSSLVPGLLAAVGVFGFACLCIFGLSILLHVRAARRLQPSDDMRLVMRGCTGGIAGNLVAAVLSAPTITSPDFFLLIAMLVATAARVRHEAGALARQDAAVPSPNFPVRDMRVRDTLQQSWRV